MHCREGRICCSSLQLRNEASVWLFCYGEGLESWSRIKPLGLAALSGAETSAGLPAEAQGRGGGLHWGPAGERHRRSMVQVCSKGVQAAGSKGGNRSQNNNDSNPLSPSGVCSLASRLHNRPECNPPAFPHYISHCQNTVDKGGGFAAL